MHAALRFQLQINISFAAELQNRFVTIIKVGRLSPPHTLRQCYVAELCRECASLVMHAYTLM